MINRETQNEHEEINTEVPDFTATEKLGEQALYNVVAAEVDETMAENNQGQETQEGNIVLSVEGFSEDAREMHKARVEIETDNSFKAYMKERPNLGTDPETIKQLIETTMQEKIKGARIAINCRSKGALKIFRDKRLRSQFETNTTGGGYLVQDERANIEQTNFGYPLDLDPSDRPIYGYLTVEPGDVDSELSRSVAKYGPVKIIMKESVKDRTTATWCDSLDQAAVACPSPISKMEYTTYPFAAIGSLEEVPDPLSEKGIDQTRSYVEAQIHGGVLLEDIEMVYMPNPDDPDYIAFLGRFDPIGIQLAQELNDLRECVKELTILQIPISFLPVPQTA